MLNRYYTALIIGLTLAASCTRVAEVPENKDVTMTYYDTAADFSAYRTFVIRDTVAFVAENGRRLSANQSLQVSSIIPQIVSQLLRRGYVQADSIADADISINILLADVPESDFTSLPELLDNSNIDSYLNWYSGGYHVWAGFSGFWYPWTYNKIESSTGVLLIEMADGQSIRDAIQSGSAADGTKPQIKFLWQSIMTGVVSDGAYNAEKSARYIEESFDQSPYLLKSTN